jgi:hypothetical protein
LKTNSSILLRLFTRKIALIIFISASVAAFATLGDGKNTGGGKSSSKSLLSIKRNIAPGSFTLKSGYNFRDIQVNKTEKNFINLNTVVTYQKGNSTYVLPLKKKVLLNKVTFNPDSKTRN